MTDVRVDRRVELLSIVMRLAGAPEYLKTPASSYIAEVDRTFGPFATHPAIAATRTLRSKHGISYDAPMVLAVHLDDQLQPRSLDELASLDRRWAGVDVAAYVTQLRDFAAASKFGDFFTAQTTHYDTVARTLRTVVDAENPVGWFDGFFGPRKDARFIVVPGLLTGQRNFGVRVTLADRSTEMFQILGVTRPDGMPSTDEETVGLLVHEMAHSYINPIFERHRAKLEAAGTKLFALVEQPMRAQAYGEWHTVLNEAGVRAITVLYLRDKKGDEVGARAARAELRLSFVWTNELVEVFRKYQRDRAKHGSFEAFMPTVIAFFDELVVQYKDGLPKSPFLGPVNAALIDPVMVAPAGGELSTYVGQIRDKLFAAAPLVAATALTYTEHPNKNLVAYGTPATNPIIANVLEHARITITADAITLGKKQFTGPGLVLVMCRYRQDDPTRGVAIYAAGRDRDLVGINHNLRHGNRDWLVARRTAKGFEILDSGDFPRAVDGAWLLP